MAYKPQQRATCFCDCTAQKKESKITVKKKKNNQKSYRIKIARKPSSVLGCITRSVGRRSREMINPLYLALTTPHRALRLVLVPDTKQALINRQGGPWACPGRFWLDRRKPRVLHQDSQALEQGPKGVVRPLSLRGLQGWPDKSLSKLVWTQCWSCSKKEAALADFPRLIWTILSFYGKKR